MSSVRMNAICVLGAAASCFLVLQILPIFETPNITNISPLRGRGLTIQEPPNVITADAGCYQDQACIGTQVLCAGLPEGACNNVSQKRYFATENDTKCVTKPEHSGQDCHESLSGHTCYIRESNCVWDGTIMACVLEQGYTIVMHDVPNQCWVGVIDP